MARSLTRRQAVTGIGLPLAGSLLHVKPILIGRSEDKLRRLAETVAPPIIGSKVDFSTDVDGVLSGTARVRWYQAISALSGTPERAEPQPKGTTIFRGAGRPFAGHPAASPPPLASPPRVPPSRSPSPWPTPPPGV